MIGQSDFFTESNYKNSQNKTMPCYKVTKKGAKNLNEILKVNYETEVPTMSARDLYEALEVGTPFTMWFDRMKEYGFEEEKDFITEMLESTGGRPSKDYQISIDMAKEICMIQRTEKGRQCRQYFIELEKKWNSPEQIMARALGIAQKELDKIRNQNFMLEEKVTVQNQQIAELQPKASYYDLVLNNEDLISTTVIAKDYGKSATWLNKYLNERGIQFKQGKIWLLYQKYAEQGYTSTKTHTYLGENGEQHTKVHTYWTQKGRLFIYDLMKSDGMLPLIEQ